MSACAKGNDIDAFVSGGGGGDRITVMMMPDERAWRFVDITAAAARQLAQRLNDAASNAEKNTQTN